MPVGCASGFCIMAAQGFGHQRILAQGLNVQHFIPVVSSPVGMSRGNNDCTCRLTQHCPHRHSDSLLEVSDVCWADCLLSSGGSWCYPFVSSVVLLQTFRFCCPLVTFCRAHYACSLASESLMNTRPATSEISQNKLLPMLFLLKSQGGLLHLPLRKGVSLSILPLTCSVSSNGPYMLNHSLEMRVARLACFFFMRFTVGVNTAGGFIIALAMALLLLKLCQERIYNAPALNRADALPHFSMWSTVSLLSRC